MGSSQKGDKKNLEINYKEIAEKAVQYAKSMKIALDYSKESIQSVDEILDSYHEQLAAYDGKEGADTLWNIAVHFGIYLGETLLRLQLEAQGYAWYFSDGLPILKKNNSEMSPITKAHKRILYGAEDSVKSFCDVAFLIGDGKFPTKNVNVWRIMDVELSSGKTIKNVLWQDIDNCIRLVDEGKEDFLILNSQDSFLQFYGYNNQFVGEVRINLENGDFRTYAMIDENKEQLLERVSLTTPFGDFTPTIREIISLERIRENVKKYYEYINTDDFVKAISCVDTTEETKKYMKVK